MNAMSNLEVHATGDLGTGNHFTQVEVRKGGNYNKYGDGTTVNNFYNVERVRPMIITKIINRLSDPNLPPVDPSKFDVKRYKIPEKIEFNHIERWKGDINFFAPHRINVDLIYQEFLNQGQNKRDRVYNWLHREYKRLHERYDADELFDQLKSYVYHLVSNDITLFDTIDFEDVDYNICIVLVDAFVECEIFEKPE